MVESNNCDKMCSSTYTHIDMQIDREREMERTICEQIEYKRGVKERMRVKNTHNSGEPSSCSHNHGGETVCSCGNGAFASSPITFKVMCQRRAFDIYDYCRFLRLFWL